MCELFCVPLQSCPGLEQYSIKKFAEAFEALPRALAENSGVKGTELISKLYAAHHEGNKNMGFDIEVSERVAARRTPDLLHAVGSMLLLTDGDDVTFAAG